MSRQAGTGTYGIMEGSFVSVMTRRSASDVVALEGTRGTRTERQRKRKAERAGAARGR